MNGALAKVVRLHLSRTRLKGERDKNKTLLGHVVAFKNPKGIEKPIVKLVCYLAEYADEHAKRYGPIGGIDAGVVGEQWRTIMRASRQLIVHDRGRLDGEALDWLLVEIGLAAGMTPAEMED